MELVLLWVRLAALALAVGGSASAPTEEEAVAAPDLDLVLYGATGCVGGIAARYLATLPDLRWAVAGRNASEVGKLARELCASPGTSSCPQQIVSTLDASVDGWVKRTRAVATAAGPFSIHGGEFLVEACARLGVHYVDTSDEFYWQRQMVDAHDAAAKNSGARVVLAGGFCALVADLGSQLAIGQADAVEGLPFQVESWLETYNGGVSAGVINTGKAMLNATFPKEWNSDPYVLAPEASAGLKVDTSVTGVGKLDWDYFEHAVTENLFGPYDARLLRRSFVSRGQAVKFRTGAPPSMYTKWAAFLAARPGSWPSLATCPTQKILDDGSWQVRVRAQQGALPRTSFGEVVLSGDGDPGYHFTAVSLAEVGLCLAAKTPGCLRTAGSGGVQTAMTALEPEVVKSRWEAVRLLSVALPDGAGVEEPNEVIV